jgi:hypothetical protein
MDSERFTVNGLQVMCSVPDVAARAGLVEKLRRAIDRVATLDARRYRWLRAIDALEILPGAGAGYSLVFHTIVVGPAVLDGHPADVVANILVHEATHARVARIVAPSRHNIEELERISITNQFDFLRRLAASGTPIDLPEQIGWLAGLWHQRIASKQELREQNMKFLLANGVPRWIAFFVARVVGFARDEIRARG